jgi:hypothetical protein
MMPRTIMVSLSDGWTGRWNLSSVERYSTLTPVQHP